jgi:hypothetical protein
MKAKHADQIQIEIGEILEKRLLLSRVQVELLAQERFDIRRHVEQAYGEQKQIEYVRIGLHQIEYELNVLQFGQIAFALQRLVYIDHIQNQLVQQGVLIIIGQL